MGHGALIAFMQEGCSEHRLPLLILRAVTAETPWEHAEVPIWAASLTPHTCGPSVLCPSVLAAGGSGL